MQQILRKVGDWIAWSEYGIACRCARQKSLYRRIAVTATRWKEMIFAGMSHARAESDAVGLHR